MDRFKVYSAVLEEQSKLGRVGALTPAEIVSLAGPEPKPAKDKVKERIIYSSRLEYPRKLIECWTAGMHGFDQCWYNQCCKPAWPQPMPLLKAYLMDPLYPLKAAVLSFTFV